MNPAAVKDDRDTSRTRPLQYFAANKTSPALTVEVAIKRFGGVDVVIVTVPKARTLVATTAGRYVRRAIGVDGSPQCLPLLPHEAQARTTLLGGRDLSVAPLTELSIADLDPTEFDRFRRLAGGGGDGHLAGLSDLDLLSALGFRSVDGSLTLGAALLFGTPEVLQTFVPTHSVVFQALDESDAVRANRRQPCLPEPTRYRASPTRLFSIFAGVGRGSSTCGTR